MWYLFHPMFPQEKFRLLPQRKKRNRDDQLQAPAQHFVKADILNGQVQQSVERLQYGIAQPQCFSGSVFGSNIQHIVSPMVHGTDFQPFTAPFRQWRPLGSDRSLKTETYHRVLPEMDLFSFRLSWVPLFQAGPDGCFDSLFSTWCCIHLTVFP